MRKFTDEVESVLKKVEDALNRDLKKGGSQYPSNEDRDEFARELGVRDFRQFRAVVANAIKDSFRVRTHKYADMFKVINSLCIQYEAPEVAFKIEKITRKRKPTMFSNEQLRRLSEGKTVSLSDGRTFKLVEIPAEVPTSVG